MTVEPLVPDAAPAITAAGADPAAFADALDGLGRVLDAAERAEDGFAAGVGSLQDEIYARARADVALSVATAAVQRGAQALTTIFNLSV